MLNDTINAQKETNYLHLFWLEQRIHLNDTCEGHLFELEGRNF